MQIATFFIGGYAMKKSCANCGKLFTATNDNQRFCGRLCRYKHFQRNKTSRGIWANCQDDIIFLQAQGYGIKFENFERRVENE